MIKNVILIDHENYTSRREELFYIQELIDLGYHVEVWDISSYLYPNIKIAGGIQRNFVHEVTCLNTLKNLLQRTTIVETAFIVEVPDSYSNRAIYRLLADYNCKTIKINCYGNSSLRKSKKDILQKIFKGSFTGLIKDHIWFNLNKIYKKRYHIHVPTYYLTSNFESCTHKINHPDFEKIRDYKQNPIISKDYIVFIDIFFPDHPDFKTLAKRSKMPDREKYRSNLKSFFDYIEKKYQMPIVIAAHPKSEFEGHEFGNRQIIKYHTDNLIHFAKIALLHESCSLSYLIYDNIPTIFFVTDELLEIKLYNYSIKNRADYCKKELYNISHRNFDNIIPSTFSEDIRKDYIYTYLTSPETEKKKNIDIIQNLLKDI